MTNSTTTMTEFAPSPQAAAAALVKRLEKHPDVYGHLLAALDDARGERTRAEVLADRVTGGNPDDWVPAA